MFIVAGYHAVICNAFIKANDALNKCNTCLVCLSLLTKALASRIRDHIRSSSVL